MHNEPSSAATSPSEPHYNADLSEADYLAREVADAKAALGHALADLKSGLSTSADLRLWVKHYPWAALGAAAAAGFAAGAVVTPAPGESLTDKLSKLKPNGRQTRAEEGAPSDRQKTSNVGSGLTGSLFDLAKTLVESLIIASVRAPAGSHTAATAAAAAEPAASPEPWQTRMGSM